MYRIEKTDRKTNTTEVVFESENERASLAKFKELSDSRTHELDPHYQLADLDLGEVVYDTRFVS